MNPSKEYIAHILEEISKEPTLNCKRALLVGFIGVLPKKDELLTFSAKKNKEMLIALISECAYVYNLLSPEEKDAELSLVFAKSIKLAETVRCSPICVPKNILLENDDVVEAFLTKNDCASNWHEMPLTIKRNKKFAIAAVRANGSALRYLWVEPSSKKGKNNFETYQNIFYWKRDKDVVMEAINQNLKAYKCISTELEEDPDVLALVLRSGDVLDLVPHQILRKPYVMSLLLQDNPVEFMMFVRENLNDPAWMNSVKHEIRNLEPPIVADAVHVIAGSNRVETGFTENSRISIAWMVRFITKTNLEELLKTDVVESKDLVKEEIKKELERKTILEIEPMSSKSRPSSRKSLKSP